MGRLDQGDRGAVSLAHAATPYRQSHGSTHGVSRNVTLPSETLSLARGIPSQAASPDDGDLQLAPIAYSMPGSCEPHP